MSKKNIFGKNIAPKGSDRIILDKIIKNSVFAALFCIPHALTLIAIGAAYDLLSMPVLLIFMLAYIITAIAFESVSIKDASSSKATKTAMRDLYDFKKSNLLFDILSFVVYIVCVVFFIDSANARHDGLAGFGPGLMSFFGIFCITPFFFILTALLDYSCIKAIGVKLGIKKK